MHPYSYNDKYAAKINEEIDKLREAGFIYEMEHTKWVSFLVVVLKKNKKLKVWPSQNKNSKHFNNYIQDLYKP